MAQLKDCTSNFYSGLCGVNVVIDPQSTNVQSNKDKVLIIGQRSDEGIADGLHQVIEETRGELFGNNSMLNRMIEEFKDIAPQAEVWVYALPNTGTASVATMTVTGVDTARSSGKIYFWVNGQIYQVSFDPEQDTNDSVASKIQSVISATNETLLATATGNVVTVETLIKGAIGSFLDVRASYDRRQDKRSSSEVTLAIKVKSGDGLPNLSGIQSVSKGFEFVINPYTDDASIQHISTYLCGQWSGGANSRAFGVFYGSATEAQAVGTNTNNALFSYMAIKGALTPSYLESVSYGAKAYDRLNSSSNEIAMSLTSIVMPAMLAPEVDDLYSNEEKSALVASGIGYFDINRINEVMIGRAVTTYTTDETGSIDISLQDVNKPSQIAYLSRYFREKLTAKYTGYALRRDGVVGSASNKVITLVGVRNYVITLASSLSELNLIQDLNGFAESLKVRLNDSGCIEIIVDPELVDQFCCLTVTLNTI